jgi:hypothetical protein
MTVRIRPLCLSSANSSAERVSHSVHSPRWNELRSTRWRGRSRSSSIFFYQTSCYSVAVVRVVKSSTWMCRQRRESREAHAGQGVGHVLAFFILFSFYFSSSSPLYSCSPLPFLALPFHSRCLVVHTFSEGTQAACCCFDNRRKRYASLLSTDTYQS